MESVKTGDEIRSCSHFLRTTRLQSAAFCKESFVFACLTYKNVQRFWNRPVHKFDGLKDSQMSKICGSSHEYPHVEKIKNLREQNFEGEANKQLLNELTSIIKYLSLTLV